MILGFTGTRKGMTGSQARSVVYVLTQLKPDEVHHGICEGSDEQFHKLVRTYLPDAKIIGHPGVDKHGASPTRAKWVERDCDELRDPGRYLDRDQDMVDESDVYLATPDSPTERQRSGTWATVRRARDKPIPLTIVLPDGELKKEP